MIGLKLDHHDLILFLESSACPEELKDLLAEACLTSPRCTNNGSCWRRPGQKRADDEPAKEDALENRTME